MMSEDPFDWWLEAIEGLYELAKKDRLRELNGGRVSRWRGDGLHEWSYLWGRADAWTPHWLQEAIAECPAQLIVTPRQLQEAAEADALAEFTHRILTRARPQQKKETEEETTDP
jgi:hypothetical protein